MDIFEKLKALSAPAPTENMEYIVIGLGNVGTQYEGTRLNAGFMVIDNLARKYNIDVKKLKFKSLCGDAMISGKRCLLMKPSTFMNNSGEALVEAMSRIADDDQLAERISENGAKIRMAFGVDEIANRFAKAAGII